MYFSKSILSVALFAALGSAQAAVIFVDSANDAGSTFGSTDTFVGAPLLTSLNGTSNNLLLETLDPGLVWGNFMLTVHNVSDVQAAPVATLGGLNGTLTNVVDVDPRNRNPLQGFDYTFTFAGTLNPGYTALTLGGFSSNALAGGGSVSLTATAVPEPESYAMMVAGLGVLGMMGRRRKTK